MKSTFADLSSASDDCPGNVSEYWHGCHHDIPTSMSPEVLDASVCPDSDGFSEKYSDSLKSVANDSQNLNAHSISGNVDVKLENVLDSGAEMSNKSQVEAINMQSKLSAGGYCDISQISGVNEKAKLTPLSQIGFRDPASGGSGQNLTLLSLEVWILACYVFSSQKQIYTKIVSVLITIVILWFFVLTSRISNRIH